MSVVWNSHEMWAMFSPEVVRIEKKHQSPLITMYRRGQRAIYNIPFDLFAVTGIPDGDCTIERPYEWQVPTKDTPMDAPCFRRKCGGSWIRAHFAGRGHAESFMVWDNGQSSWTSAQKTMWKYVVLADPTNPDRVPPEDFYPSAQVAILEARP